MPCHLGGGFSSSSSFSPSASSSSPSFGLYPSCSSSSFSLSGPMLPPLRPSRARRLPARVPVLTLLPPFSFCLVGLGAASTAAAVAAAEAAEAVAAMQLGETDSGSQGEEEEDPLRSNESQECWSYAGGDKLGFTPETCCRPAPCGQAGCWSPPEFQYHFCCEEPACRPRVTSGIQNALLMTAGMSAANTTTVAQQVAGEEMATLKQRFAYLMLAATDDVQACECAYALAASWLLHDSALSQGQLANSYISVEWFVHGLDWADMVASGWGVLFALLAKEPLRRFGSQCRESVISVLRTGADRRKTPLRNLEEGATLSEIALLAQRHAYSVLLSLQEKPLWQEAQHSSCGLALVAAWLRLDGTLQELWRHVEEERTRRTQGRKCVASPDENDRHGIWSDCVPWSYSMDADFSSPAPGKGSRPDAETAVCVLGAPRSVLDTFRTIREKVIKVVEGDVFAYIPFSGEMSTLLERQLKNLGQITTAIVVPDVDAEGFEKRFLSELAHPSLAYLYEFAPGPWRAPIFGQMGSSMWGYFHQDVCNRMVISHEHQRGKLYKWVIFARADILWTYPHPPMHLLDENFVHVPFGQDNSFYNHGPEPGLNDRHAVIPRKWANDYLGRIAAMRDGRAFEWYIKDMAEAGHLINTEQFLLLHLRARGVPIRRFSPVAFIVQCTEGPQCQHLYKGTDLGKQQWTQTAKYWTELVEARRTVHDDRYGLSRRHDWIWTPLRPHTTVDGEEAPEWMLHSVELACCITQSGPATCNRLWPLLRRCQCIT